MRKDLEENKNKRIGEENYNNFGTLMKIVEYNKCSDIIVEFQDEYKARVHTEYKNFKKGNVRNPYDKTLYNIGYIGNGKYKPSKNRKDTKAYKKWHKMLHRCYDPYYLNTHPTYRDCIVCEEWHNFQNFAEWFYKHYYECNGEKMCLDKDILIKGNKIYSPNTCMIVPERINMLFNKRQNCRGKLPIGCTFFKRDDVIMVYCDILEERKFLEQFPINRPFQAFTCYKNYKENYIKQVADEYKELIPQKLYEVLCKYEVEIND